MGKRAKKEREKGQKQGAQSENGDRAKVAEQMEHRPAFTGQPVIMSVAGMRRIIICPIHSMRTVCSSQGQIV